MEILYLWKADWISREINEYISGYISGGGSVMFPLYVDCSQHHEYDLQIFHKMLNADTFVKKKLLFTHSETHWIYETDYGESDFSFCSATLK